MLDSGNKDIKKLFSKILLIAIIVFALDFTIGKTLKHLYFTQTSGLHYRTTYAMDSTHADILIFGSSRANHHYDPRVLEEEMEMSCYNTGRDGNFLLFNYAIFKTIIQRYSPKIVIFDVNNDELKFNNSHYERLSTLLPYYNNDEIVDGLLLKKSPFEKLKLVSDSYPFNSLLLTIAVGNTDFNKTRKFDFHGFVPLTGVWNKQIEMIDEQKLNLINDPVKEEAFIDIINDCQSKGIKLLLVNSPVYVNYANTSLSNIISDITNKNQVIYLDYSSDSVFLSHPEYFADPGHLNKDGAKIFSEIIVNYLKQYYGDSITVHKKN